MFLAMGGAEYKVQCLRARYKVLFGDIHAVFPVIFGLVQDS
jgi:hypothetical protein